MCHQLTLSPLRLTCTINPQTYSIQLFTSRCQALFLPRVSELFLQSCLGTNYPHLPRQQPNTCPSYGHAPCPTALVHATLPGTQNTLPAECCLKPRVSAGGRGLLSSHETGGSSQNQFPTGGQTYGVPSLSVTAQMAGGGPVSSRTTAASPVLGLIRST